MNRQSNKITALYCRLAHYISDEDKMAGKCQMETLTRYVLDKHLENAHFYCDWGCSGTELGRPGYQRLIQDVLTEKVSALVVVDVSRLTRNSLDALELIENVFPEYGVALHVVKEGREVIGTLTKMQKAIIELYWLRGWE